MKKNKMIGLACAISTMAMPAIASAVQETNLYWGDTHLHTSYSLDAYLNSNHAAEPDTAYRWAKGQPVLHPYTQARIQIETPLDFLVVSDHAEYIGFVRAVAQGSAILSEMGPVDGLKRWFAFHMIKRAIENGEGSEFFLKNMPKAPVNKDGNPVTDENNPHMVDPVFGDPTENSRTAWQEVMTELDKHYEPGKFTTFVGWEWTSLPTGANLHRVVMSSSSGEEAKQYIPFGADQSQYPEDLWSWLEKTEEETGVEFIAIPHNSNISKGYMFPEITLKGKPIDVDYAKRRLKYEPIVEVTQIKGDSETHPLLSPEDEFADFEPYEFYLQSGDPTFHGVKEGDYARSALKRGLKIEKEVGVNPYKFGMIGSTDAHTSVSSAEENNFWGKMAIDSIPDNKIKASHSGIPAATGWDMSASGLAAVWAPENTREAIFDAFKRKEVYSTTGPRIKVRFFGGWEFEGFDSDGSNIAELGYSNGVPMGSDLSQTMDKSAAPEFLLQAVRDPKTANLDRIQIVKGWVDTGGQTHEKIYDVVWSGDRKIDAKGKLPAVGDTVNRKTGEVQNSIGSPELITKWRDPDFDPGVASFYYARVMQIPTARHSLLDTLALGVAHPDNLPAVIQERAYTSPIWYTPR